MHSYKAACHATQNYIQRKANAVNTHNSCYNGPPFIGGNKLVANNEKNRCNAQVGPVRYVIFGEMRRLVKAVRKNPIKKAKAKVENKEDDTCIFNSFQILEGIILPNEPKLIKF
jgi:hypothetical protein